MIVRRPFFLRALVAAVLLALLPAAVRAQGSLSAQGFGYPSGGLSTRTLGAGGALGEIDPLSMTNPASLVDLGGTTLYLQAEPEYRSLRVAGNTERTTIARYPLVSAGIPITPSLFAGVSVTNLLDRSFTNVVHGSQVVGGETVSSTNTFSSDGAIGDVQLALAWAPVEWIHLGGGVHAITGDNRLTNVQQFDDTARFAALRDTSTLTYVGNALSGGVELYAGRAAVVTASYRRGGPISLKHGDTTRSSAHVPDRLAFSAAYLGIRGTSIAVRTAKDRWSDLRGLGSPGLHITDSWDTSVGADVFGPRLAGRPLQLRAGARWRTLPFGVGTSDVKERSLSIGAGTLFARGRAALDVAGIHATRDAGISTTESAWTLSIGLTVRP